MNSPKNRKDFERHFDILVEKIKKGKFRIPPSRKLENSLLNVKQLPNGRINFFTIDESARLLANSLAHFDRPEFRKEKDDEQ
jgi:hypothetical protein